METRRRVETIYELLDGCGYFHWLVAAATDANSQTPETRYVLVNFKDRKKTEIAVSDEWLDDPRRHHLIEQLIRLAVDNSSPLSPQETHSTLFFIKTIRVKRRLRNSVSRYQVMSIFR